MGVLAAVVVAVFLGGCVGGPGTGADAESEAPLIAFHLAHGEESDLEARVFEGRRIYLEKHPVISDPDFLRIDTDLRDRGVTLDVELRPDAAERMRRITGENIGRGLAILFDSKVISVPVIQSEVGGRAQMLIPADSNEEAQRFLELVRDRWPSD